MLRKTRHALFAAALAALYACAPQGASAQPKCMPYEDTKSYLDYEEYSLTFRGISGDGSTVFELWTQEDGSFIAWNVYADGNACLAGAGTKHETYTVTSGETF